MKKLQSRGLEKNKEVKIAQMKLLKVIESLDEIRWLSRCRLIMLLSITHAANELQAGGFLT